MIQVKLRKCTLYFAISMHFQYQEKKWKEINWKNEKEINGKKNTKKKLKRGMCFDTNKIYPIVTYTPMIYSLFANLSGKAN